MDSPVIDESVGDRSSMSPETRAINERWKKTANSYYSSSQSNPMDSRDRTPLDSDDEGPSVIDESVGDRSSMSPETRAINERWKKTANSYFSSSQSNPMDSRDRTPPDSDDEGVIDEESRNAQQNLRLVTEVIQMLEIEEEMTSQASPIPTSVMVPVNPEDESSSTEQIGQQHQSTEELIRVHDSEDMFHESDVGSVIEGTPVVRRIKKPNRASKRGSVGDVDELTKRKSQRLTDKIGSQSQDASSYSNGQQPRTTVAPMVSRDHTPQDSDEGQQISDEILRQIEEMTHPVRVVVKRFSQSTAEPPAIPHRKSTRSFTQSSGEKERSSGDLQPASSSIRNNGNHSVTGEGRNIGARYADEKCPAKRKVSLESPLWLQSLLFEYDSANSKTLQNVAKLELAHRTWSTVRNNLSSKYGLSNYFDAKFWGKYFGRAKQPQTTLSMVSANGQNVRKRISEALKSLVPNKQGQKRCFFLISSTIVVPPTTALHSAVLVAVNEAEKFTYYYYETMADRPTDSYTPMRFVIDELKDLTQLTGFHIIFGSQRNENDCFQRCINFVHRIASGDELIATDFYTMENCSRGEAGLLYKVEDM